jgi:hypothetical protein
MPKSKPLYTMPETPEPGDQPGQVQRGQPEAHDRKGLSLGEPTAQDIVVSPADDRAGAVADTAGALTGAYQPGELGRRREDWSAERPIRTTETSRTGGRRMWH